MMATMTFFLFCIISQSFVILEPANADPLVSATPTHINIGLSDSLQVNCTDAITNNPSIAGLMSLILSRANATSQIFTEVATINSFASHSVNVLTTESVTATGNFNAAGESFLNMRWEYPTEEQAGEYKCTAQGMDSLGHIIVLNDVIQVTASQPSSEEWREKIKEMDIRMKYLEETVVQMGIHLQQNVQNVSDLDSYTKNMESDIMVSIKTNDTILENNVERLEQIVTFLSQERLNNISAMFKDDILTYERHKYYISRDAYYRIEAAYAICHVYGGWLVEIDDVEEYTAIQNFMKTTSGIDGLIISGTDEGHEGTWLLPSTNQPLPYTDWSPGNGDGGTRQNCLYFHKNDWRMWDWFCMVERPTSSHVYMCEIPDI